MAELYKIIVSIIIVIVLGRYLVEWIVNNAIKLDKISIPEGIDEEKWRDIVKRPSGGEWIGNVERLIFLFSFWYNAYPIIAGWFAFKLAAKWEAWKNIIQVPRALKIPKTQEEVSELSYLKARNDWGTFLFVRLIVGTGSNVLLSLFAEYIGKNICEFCRFLLRT